MSTARLPLQPISVLSALLAYLGTIYGTQIAMASRPPFQLKRTVQTYNLGVGGASLVLLLLIYAARNCAVGFPGGDRECDVLVHPALTASQTLETYYLFTYLTKYVELLDTVFLVLKKKPLRFIHVYHHAATIFMASTSLEGRNVFSWVVIAVNLFVHAIMYGWRAFGHGIVGIFGWGIPLTFLCLVEAISDLPPSRSVCSRQLNRRVQDRARMRDHSIADGFLNLSSLVQCAETLSTALRTKVEKLEIELATAKSRTAAMRHYVQLQETKTHQAESALGHEQTMRIAAECLAHDAEHPLLTSPTDAPASKRAKVENTTHTLDWRLGFRDLLRTGLD
ncbi:GNS1/SUR4 family-domain-containing protein [Mycena epipterygia]|nr:GNS1/SUR4 family-domain-containing protein [Mycena epipterygia]